MLKTRTGLGLGFTAVSQKVYRCRELYRNHNEHPKEGRSFVKFFRDDGSSTK